MKQVLSFIVFLTFSSSFAGKVVFLHGTGCAGKTSMCNELMSLSDDWRLVSEDDIFYEEAALRWKKEFSDEFEAVEEAVDKENVLHAVMRNQILFRSDASIEQREKAKFAIDAIQKELNGRQKSKEKEDPSSWSNTLRKKITRIIIDVAATKHVIVDTWFLKNEHIDEIAEQHEVKHVAAYCSFVEIIRRTLKRNHDALLNGRDISNLRFFHQALNSFIGLYDFTDTKDGSIGELSKEEMVHGCDLVSLCLDGSPNATGAEKTFSRGEFSLQEFEEYRANLLKKFSKDKVYIHPKRKLDFVIRTEQESALECAKKIAKMNK